MGEINGQYTFDMWVPNLGSTTEVSPKKKSVNSFQTLESEGDEDDEEEVKVTDFQRQHKD